MNTNDRYQFLLCLMREDVATDAEKKEFYDLCQEMLYAKLLENIDVLKRLKDR
jgi:hypothetical protein